MRIVNVGCGVTPTKGAINIEFFFGDRSHLWLYDVQSLSKRLSEALFTAIKKLNVSLMM